MLNLQALKDAYAGSKSTSPRNKKFRRGVRRHIKTLLECGFPERAKVWKALIKNW